MKKTNFYGINYRQTGKDFIRPPLKNLSRCLRTHEGGGVIMEEIKLKQVAQIKGSYESTGRIYSDKGLSPTLNTCGGGNLEPKIMENCPIAFDEQNNYLRKDGTVGTLTTDGSSPKHNNRIVEPIVYDDYNGRIKADQNSIGTLTTNCGNSTPHNGIKLIEPNYKIRKLTEKECFRLMGVTDKQFEAIKSNQSKTSLYHLAGDSIVVAVLVAILGQCVKDFDFDKYLNNFYEQINVKEQHK